MTLIPTSSHGFMCQHVNKKLEKPAASLHPISVHSPWHRIGIDLVGPLPISKSGNSYIITCLDYFTKWPEAAAIPDKSAESVSNFLFKLITRHGSPVVIQSDQGREFVNQVRKDDVIVHYSRCHTQMWIHIIRLFSIRLTETYLRKLE